MTIGELLDEVIKFRDVRDWRQFHTLRNLIVSTSIEAGELLETVQWKTDAEIEDLLHDAKARKHLEQECADVFIYLMLVANTAGFDLIEAAADKLKLNEERYPVGKARGTATKYTDL